eukprot:s291_g20.t1
MYKARLLLDSLEFCTLQKYWLEVVHGWQLNTNMWHFGSMDFSWLHTMLQISASAFQVCAVEYAKSILFLRRYMQILWSQDFLRGRYLQFTGFSAGQPAEWNKGAGGM